MVLKNKREGGKIKERKGGRDEGKELYSGEGDRRRERKGD